MLNECINHNHSSFTCGGPYIKNDSMTILIIQNDKFLIINTS